MSSVVKAWIGICFWFVSLDILYCYLSGTVMVTIESQWLSAETHSEQGPGKNNGSSNRLAIGTN